MSDYVSRLNGLMRWMCDATNFRTDAGEFDLHFALQVYLSIYVLLNATYRIVTEQVDMFARKMALFDALELYSGLVDSSDMKLQAEAWKIHVSAVFAGQVESILSTYVAPYGEDLSRAAHERRSLIVLKQYDQDCSML